jgi:ribose/xylose/arabinose/galactoside ABC-type transport system permease subunit
MQKNQNTQTEVKRRGQILSKFPKNLSLVFIIAVLVAVFGAINSSFFSINNIINIFRQTSVLSLVAIGMALIIIDGGFDLSVGANLAVGGAIGAMVMGLSGNSALAIISVLVTCTLIGTLNGVAVGVLNINPFMFTLAMAALTRGLTLGLMNAQSVGIQDAAFLWLGSTQIGILPVVMIFVVIAYIVFYFILSRNAFGLKIYAVGGNIQAARASGINTKMIVTYTYIITGLLVGIGSVITIGRIGSVQPWVGVGLEFDVITAVIIGGVSLRGGEGTMLGTFLGALTIGILINGLSFMAIDPFFQYIIRGIIIIVVVLIDNIMHKNRSASY